MHDNRSHPFLQQVPLTVSPFVNLPTATTLPYTYKPMPSALPPSASGITSDSAAGGPEPKYVVSPSGHAAHPNDIIASCRALRDHIAKLTADAEAEIKAIDERIKAAELAEKRRLAPGWLDSDVRVLQPERKSVAPDGSGIEGFGQLSLGEGGHGEENTSQQQQGHGPGGASEMAVPDEGEELDRAFGKLGMGGPK
ncbi:hypothetical protein QC761_206400 [Podospora bellae-mahoneyi]|uniref:Mediator of RNA polymerase II transcription subunit 4 n=1 Tax=Podospora bellae-mahoneyi TaxID=2093777 RepID=A0ABR0FS88_9PEZI|nr:hypothetical protein QC761_206400 [Podospora bellae-mahoneyi]